MAQKQTCSCREEVHALVWNGRLRDALMSRSGISEPQRDSIVRQACENRSVRSRAVDNGRLRDALRAASWKHNHIDFLLYRSQHDHEEDN